MPPQLDAANSSHVSLRVTAGRARHDESDSTQVRVKEAADESTLAVASVVRAVTMLAGALCEDENRVAEVVLLGRQVGAPSLFSNKSPHAGGQHFPTPTMRLIALQRQRKARWAVTMQGHLGGSPSRQTATSLCGDLPPRRHSWKLPFISGVVDGLLALPTHTEPVRC